MKMPSRPEGPASRVSRPSHIATEIRYGTLGVARKARETPGYSWRPWQQLIVHLPRSASTPPRGSIGEFGSVLRGGVPAHMPSRGP